MCSALVLASINSTAEKMIFTAIRTYEETRHLTKMEYIMMQIGKHNGEKSYYAIQSLIKCINYLVLV